MSIRRTVALTALALAVATALPASASAISPGTDGSASWEGNSGVGATLTVPRLLVTSATQLDGTVPVHFQGYVNPPCGDVWGVWIDWTGDASVTATPNHITVSAGPGIVFPCPSGWPGAGNKVFPFHLDADLVAQNLSYVSPTEVKATGSRSSTINIVMGTNDPRYNYRVATTTYQPFLDLGTTIDTVW